MPHTPKTPEQKPTTPLKARIMLAHAYFQWLAERHGVDILHIKGYVFHEDIFKPNRYSTDADLLVRPSQVETFVQALLADGWSIQAHFETGSVFEHAMTLYHESWGLTDIHRFFPGLGTHPERVFQQLWVARMYRNIAHRPCAVPSVLDSRLIVVLHQARAASSYRPDLDYLHKILDSYDWARLRARAAELDSSLAYAAAMGTLQAYRHERDYLLWKSVSTRVPNYVQWFGRLRSARGFREKIRTLKNIFLVNRDHLAMELGHEPTRAEIRTKFFERFTGLGGGTR